MVNAVQVAALYGTLDLRDNFTPGLEKAKSGLFDLGGGLQDLGSRISGVGANLGALAAPFAAAFGVATKQAMDFDESMKNVQAVTGKSGAEMAKLGQEILLIGEHSRYGPQQVAQAMYDIAGGVNDASSHMAILNSAVQTAQAGNAELGGTVKALISVMNGYSFSADKAWFASNVLTQTVAKGVGTMDEFGAALPLVTGTAAQAGVSLDELAGSMAFMTTKGFSASASATRIQQSIIALLKPNKAMIAAFKAMGVESGSAALKQFGLVGTLKKLQEALGGSSDEMAKALGSSEAFSAATALNQKDFESFIASFEGGIEGATQSAQAIQMTSAAAQFDLLKSQVEGLSITVGQALLPALINMVGAVTPVINKVIEWVQANPQLVGQIAAVAGGAAILAPILIGVGAALSAIGGIIGFVMSPIGLIIVAIAALATAFATDFAGIRTTLQPIIDGIVTTINGIGKAVNDAINSIRDWANANPEFITAMAILGGAVLGLTGILYGFSLVGTIVTTGVGLLTGALGILFSPVVLLTAAIVALVYAAHKLYPGGIGKLLSDAATSAQQLGFIIMFVVNTAVTTLRQLLILLLGELVKVIDKINEFINRVSAGAEGIKGIVGGLGSGQFTIGQVIGAIGAEIRGYDGGGYTGNMPPDQVAGVVHGQEYVVPKDGALVMRSDSGSSGITINSLTIQASSAAEGRAAADAFETRLREVRRERG